MATSSFPTHHLTKKSSLYDHKFNNFSFNVHHNEYIQFPSGFLDSNSAKGSLDYTKKIGVFHNKRNFHSNGFLDLNSAKASLECTRKIGVFHNKNKISSNMLLDLNSAKVFSENRKKIGVFHTKNKLFSNGFLDLSSSKGCLEYTKKSGVFHSKHNSSSNGFLELDSAKGCSEYRKKIGALSSDGDKGQSMEPSFVEFITSERVKVVAMLALALALCNADRVVMSVAIVPLSHSNNWRQSFGGIVQSSFLWGYLISPVAGGTLVDIYGGKIVMGWGVALWSFATFITPWAAETSLWALLAVRMLLGIAEGVALPCMNNMIAKWFPQTERSRAVGLAMAGFQLGSAIGLTLSPILLSQGGICGPFVIFGLSGFLWLLVWISTTSSTPEGSQQISDYELQYINKDLVHSVVDKKMQKSKGIPPFRRLLSKLPTWSIIVANSMHSWGFFVILSWMPIYFNTMYHVDLRQAAWFSAVPWSMMAVVGYFAGVLSDMMIQRGISVTLTRKIMQSIGFIGPGMALIGLTMASSPVIASAWLTLAVGLKSFSHCGFLVNLQEIAPQYSGVLHGISNTAGTLAAITGTVGAGFFVELVGSFKGFLLLTSFLYFSAAVFWNMFSTGERVNFD